MSVVVFSSMRFICLYCKNSDYNIDSIGTLLII